MDKKIVAGGLIVASLVTNSFAADITYYGLNDGYSKINSINFSDVSNQGSDYWAKAAIYQVASFGIMNGFSSNSFSPTTAVTNEQAVATILNAKGKEKEVENIKMISNNWSDKYIKYAMNTGLITEKIVYKKADVKGDIGAFKDKGVFIRDLPITREEVATLIYKAFELSSVDSANTSSDNKEPIDFLDKALIDEARIAHVDAVSMAGIMVGDESLMFNPQSNLTRAEFAQILKNCEDYLLTNLRLSKRTGFIDNVGSFGFEITDDDGNSIGVNCSGRDIPVIRNNTLSGITSLRNSDEIEFFIDTSKQVVFIRVIDQGIYEDNSINDTLESVSKQGIVTGNSPYFYEISIKDKNGNIESYSYGAWTNIYKDGKETSASNILQGDTVYLEFDEIGDLVTIRGITNAVITYGTIVDVDKYDVTFKLDSDNSSKQYNLKRIPVYENGAEVDMTELYNGKYAKLYTSQSELIKVEIVLDERTAENLYMGYISEINLIQDRIILRNPKIFKNSTWETAESSFITIPLDDEMEITFDGESLEKDELGEKQIGKFAYIATRQDSKILEKVKAMNIEFESGDNTVAGEIRSYTISSGLLKLYEDSRKLYINDSTICIVDGKIVSPSSLEKGDNILATIAYENGTYFVKLITSVEKPEEKVVEVYYGEITDIESGKEVSVELSGKFDEDEWTTVKRRHTSFTITKDTRIFSETEPLTFKEFDSTYEDKKVCIIAYGNEAVSIGVMDFGENSPYISVGSVKEVTQTDFTIYDVEYFDYDEDEWLESSKNEKIVLNTNTLITKNGKFARSRELDTDQEVVVIRKDIDSPAGVVLIRE